MRVQSFYNSFTNLQNNKSRIDSALKEIQQGGISYEGFDGLHNSIKHREMVQELNFMDQFKSSIETSQHNHSLYDDNLQNIQQHLEKFNTLLIQKNNDATTPDGKAAIDIELNEIVKSVQNLEEQKLNSYEDMYKNNSSEVMIGKGIRAPRTFSNDLIQFNGSNISSNLSDIITSGSLEDIEKLQQKISMSLATVGASENSLSSQYEIISRIALHEQEQFEGLKDLEGSIIRFNEAKNGYEAQMLLISKIQDLSLHKYL